MNVSNETLWENGTAWSFSAWDGVDLGLGLGTIVANVVVLTIAFRHVALRQRLSQVFVVSMTAADLLFGLTYVTTKPFVEKMPAWTCGPYYVVTWSSSLSSVLFLLYLNMDKFLALYYPLHYPSIVTERRVVAQTGLSWAALVLFTSLSYYWGFGGLLFQPPGPFVSCTKVIQFHQLYYGIYTFVGFIIPILLSLAISVYIFYIATTIGSSEPQLSAHRRQKKRKLLWTRILFVFSSTLWTSLTVLPYRVVFAVYNLCAAGLREAKFGDSLDPCSPPLFSHVVNVLIRILPVGGLVNPLITILTQRLYRRRVLLPIYAALGLCSVRLPPPSLRQLYEDDERTVDYTASSRLHTASTRATSDARASAHRRRPDEAGHDQPSNQLPPEGSDIIGDNADPLLPHNSSQTCFQVV